MTERDSCDVSVVYSFSIENSNKKIAENYVGSIKDSNFISLNSVKQTFLATFASNLKEVCDAIVIATNKTRDEISQRSKKLPPISKTMEEITFKKHYTESIKEFVSSNNLESYETLLKSKMSIDFQDLKDQNKLEKFWDNSLVISETLALEAFDNFRKKIKNFKDAPRFTPSKQAKWESEIKNIKSKVSIFNDPDNEDIFVATEYFTYIEDRGPNHLFSALDKDLVKSINTFKEILKLKHPDAICLRM